VASGRGVARTRSIDRTLRRHASWRAFRDEMIMEPSRGFIDGDVVSTFVDPSGPFPDEAESMDPHCRSEVRVKLVTGGIWRIPGMDRGKSVKRRHRNGVLDDAPSSSSDEDMPDQVEFEPVGSSEEEILHLLEQLVRMH